MQLNEYVLTYAGIIRIGVRCAHHRAAIAHVGYGEHTLAQQ